MTKEQILKIIVPEGSIPLQTEIDKAEDILELISQEKEKMIEEIKKLKIETSFDRFKYGGDFEDWNGRNRTIDEVINLLQNK